METLLSERKTFKQSVGASYVCFDDIEIWLEEDVDEDPLMHVQFEPGETVVLSSGRMIESELLTLKERTRESILSGKVDASREAILRFPWGASLAVRSCQPGDRFRPLGAPGSKKLKDWFIDRHIPRKERKQVPVVTTTDGEVVWVPGFPPAESLKIDGQTKQALRLTYRPGEPR